MTRLGRDFRLLWTGQTVSLAGDQVATLAVPSIAILVLHAAGWQVGLLTAIGYIAYPLLGPFAGVAADRYRRRRILIACDLVRLAVFATAAVASATGQINYLLLCAAVAVTGVCGVYFDVSYQGYLPNLVEENDLAGGNAALEGSQAAAQLAGPALGGFLLQWAGPGGALAANAMSFAASLTGLSFITTPEPTRRHQPPALGEALRQGLGHVWNHPVLRHTTLAAATRNLGMTMVRTTLLLFAYRALHLSAAVTGTILAAGTAAALLGAVGARRLAAHIGLSRTLRLSACLEGVTWALAPIASLGIPVGVLVCVAAAASMWLPVWNVNVLTLRQTLTPAHLQGRTHAAARTITHCAVPVGALTAGGLATIGTAVLGARAGLAVVLLFSAAISASAVWWLRVPSISRLAHHPPSSTIAAMGP